MNRIVLIARREWRERIRQRSFRIATLINLAVVLIAACIPTAIALFQDDSPSATLIAVIDNANVGAVDQLATLFSTGIDSAVEVVSGDFYSDNVVEMIESGTVDAVLTIERGDDGQLVFEYIDSDGEIDGVDQQIVSGVSVISFADRLEQAGVSEEQFQQAATPPNLTITSSTGATESDSDDIEGAPLLVAFLIAIVMFMAIQLYGNWIAQGVVEEKANRIMEIMINAATPRDLLAGKVLGIGTAALTQLVPMLIVGGLAFALQPRIANALDIDIDSTFGSIDFGSISVRAVAGFLIFFVFGFILYASLYAGVASMLSRQEDISSAIGPLTFLMTAGYIAAFIALPDPDSLFARVISIIPFTSPFTMAGRLVTTNVPAWELALSIALLISSAAIGLLIASRIYRIGVLMYGQKPSFREVFRNRNTMTMSR